MSARFGKSQWNIVYKVALKVLKTPDQAEDAAQEAMLRAYRARESFSGKSRFDSWLRRIAFTTAVSMLRRADYRHHRTLLPEDWAHALPWGPAPRTTPEEAVGTSELAARLNGCLGGLQEQDQIAFTERFLYGTSERELGEILGVSTGAAKQRAFRARRAIRQCVKDKRANAQL